MSGVPCQLRLLFGTFCSAVLGVWPQATLADGMQDHNTGRCHVARLGREIESSLPPPPRSNSLYAHRFRTMVFSAGRTPCLELRAALKLHHRHRSHLKFKQSVSVLVMVTSLFEQRALALPPKLQKYDPAPRPRVQAQSKVPIHVCPTVMHPRLLCLVEDHMGA